MPDSRDVRSGKDLKLSAVFVPEDAGDLPSKQNAAISRGPHTLRLPAVFVPEGSSPPGHPYVHFGKMTFDQDDDDSAGQTTLSGPGTAGPPGEVQPGRPPSPPGVAGGPDDHPVAANTASRSSRNPGNTARRRPAPLGQAPHDQLTRPDDNVGRAASLASGYVGPASGATSATQYGNAGSTSQSAMGRDDQVLRRLDPSRDAIEAALRALAVPPSSGEPSQAADRETPADWPSE